MQIFFTETKILFWLQCSIPDGPYPVQKINLQVTAEQQTKIEVKTLLQLKSADLFEDLVQFYL